MAIVCRRHRLLFIQAPRTGCTAIERLLVDRFGGEVLPVDMILNEDGSVRVPRKHCSIRQLLDERLIPEDYRDLFTTVTTVRNPYDSLVSLYVKKREKYQPLLLDKSSWVHKFPRYIEDMEFCRTHSFEEWIVKHYDVGPLDRMLGRGHRSLYGRYTEGVSLVIRFERLQRDFEAMMHGLGIDGDVTIPNVNPTPQRRTAYQSYYTPRARRIVDYVFCPELKRLGYSFEGLLAHAAPDLAVGMR